MIGIKFLPVSLLALLLSLTPLRGADTPHNDLYGETGGEEVAPADPSKPDTVMRSRAGDTFYKLSNVRIGNDRFGRATLFVDYEAVKLGQYNGVTLVINGADGRRQNVLILGPMRNRGTLDYTPRFGPPGRGQFPKAFEVYFTRGDARYGKNAPTFKVSTSATVGTVPFSTKPRDWTKEEIERLSKPPPNYANANAFPNVGHDTGYAGDAAGGGSFRYVDPKGHLLGLEYRMAEWEKEKCLGGVVPIFSHDQPVTLQQRSVAREGYAVGAVKVRSQKYVDAVQLVFMKLKPDGSLDSKDAYDSDWLGDPAERPVKELTGKGLPVIGIHCRQGAILNGLALVVGEGKK